MHAPEKPKFLKSIEGSEAPHVPEGSYLARLEGIEDVTTRFGEGWRWHWTVQDPTDGADFTITQITSRATTGGSNAGRQVKALRGRGMASGESLPTTEIYGRYATLEVYVDEESGWNKIADVFPAPQQKPKLGSAEHMIQRMAAEKAAQAGASPELFPDGPAGAA
jgi:hypothetical protein